MQPGKTGLIAADGQKQMTNLLLIVVTPLLIIQSFQKAYSPQLLRGLLISLVSAILAHLLGMLLGFFAFRDRETGSRKVLIFCCGLFQLRFHVHPAAAGFAGS
jgi:predicted permease